MGKDTPAAPDYRGAAEETAGSDWRMLQEQTRANRPTQVTPWGTMSWEQGEGSVQRNPVTGEMEQIGGDWTQNISLDPRQQQALDDQLGLTAQRSDLASGMMGRVQDEFGDTMDWSQFQDLAGPLDSSERYRQDAGDALYGRATSRLDPRFDQKREATESALRNQGLRPGDEAYDTAMANLGREETDAYQQAGFGADIGAGAEASRGFAMDMQGANYQNTLRQQQIAEQMQQRGFSLNEINAILHGQQVGMPAMPGFNQAGRGSGTDYTGAAQAGYNAEMDQFSADQAAWQSVMNAGSSAMSFSDARLKRSIEYVGSALGRKFYRWVYIWGERGFGVLAHENPDMVVGQLNGYAVVDYGRI